MNKKLLRLKAIFGAVRFRYSTTEKRHITFYSKGKSYWSHLESLPHKTLNQTASFFINNESVSNIEISVAEKQLKQFIFAVPNAQDNKYTIHFEVIRPTIPKPKGLNGYRRKVSFGFISMELSSGNIAAQ